MTSLTGLMWTPNTQTKQIDCALYQGATINNGLFLTDTSNLPINITGWTAEFIADRDMNASTAAQIYLSSANGGMINGGITGIFTIAMTSTATAVLAPFSGFYSIWITSGGVRQLYMTGRFKVARET